LSDFLVLPVLFLLSSSSSSAFWSTALDLLMALAAFDGASESSIFLVARTLMAEFLSNGASSTMPSALATCLMESIPMGSMKGVDGTLPLFAFFFAQIVFVRTAPLSNGLAHRFAMYSRTVRAMIFRHCFIHYFEFNCRSNRP
jgi:hypothetical protein